MNKQILSGSILFLIICLFATSFLQFQPVKATSAFTIKAAHVSLDKIQSGQAEYVSNWSTVLHDLNINTIRGSGGNQGDSWQLNMVNYPVTWAAHLESLLSLVNGEGYKIWFQQLGDPWGTLFGIQTLSLGWPADFWNPCLVSNTNPGGWTYNSATGKYEYSLVSAYEIATGYPTTLLYLSKLAGSNSLSHNFLSDSRILCWSVGNECYYGDGSTPDANKDIYDWTIVAMDYIRSHGGKVIADCPLYGTSGWDHSFVNTVPLFAAHVDYMEQHEYRLGETPPGTPGQTWDGWKADLQDLMETDLYYADLGGFDAYHVIMGEFGLWLGNYYGITFTDADKINYYNHYFEALTDAGYKGASPYSVFLPDEYGFVTTNGVTLSGYDEIAAAYAGDPPPTPTPTATTTPSPTPTATATPSPTPTPSTSVTPTSSPGPFPTPVPGSSTPTPTATPFPGQAQAATNQVFTSVWIALGIVIISTLIAGIFMVITTLNGTRDSLRLGAGLLVASMIEAVIGIVIVNAFQGSMGTVAIILNVVRWLT